MSFLTYESMFNSRIHHKNFKSQVIYEQYFNYTFWPPFRNVNGNFNRGPISCNDSVSTSLSRNNTLVHAIFAVC